MTVVSRSFIRGHGVDDDGTQQGSVDTGGIFRVGGEVPIVPGEYSLAYRQPLEIPHRAIITSAVFTIAYATKIGTTAMTADMYVHLENSANAARFPAWNTPLSRPTFGGVHLPIYHPASGEATRLRSTNVTSQIQTLVNQDAWEYGSHFGLFLYCGAESAESDLAIRHSVEYDFEGKAGTRLAVTYTYDNEGIDSTDVNEVLSLQHGVSGANVDRALLNQKISAVAPPSPSPLGAPLVMKVEPSQAHIDQAQANFGASFEHYATDAGESVGFSCWVYNPSANADGIYYTVNNVQVLLTNLRDQWVPICQPPVVETAGFNQYFGVMVVTPAIAGAHFFVDGLTMVRSSDLTLMPFTALSPVLRGREYESKGGQLGYGPTVRRTATRTNVLVGATTKPRRRWVRGSGAPGNLLVPADARHHSVTARQPLTANGNVVLTPGVTYAGRAWTRVLANTAFHGVRVNAPLNRLVAEQQYLCSWLVANDGGAAVNLSVDWCDGGTTVVAVQPGQQLRVVSASHVRAYDATYRFTDLALSTAGQSILVAADEVRVVLNPPPYAESWAAEPAGPWTDMPVGATWASW